VAVGVALVMLVGRDGADLSVAQGDASTTKEGRFAGLVSLRLRLAESGLAPSDVLEDRVCGEFAKMCPYVGPTTDL
jgi:hypothetical protein